MATPSDKLPKDTIAKIKADATAAYADIPRFVAYTKGATAWAPWKLKYDEAKADFERVQKSAIHYANRKDEVEKQRDEAKADLHETKQQADNLRNAYDELGRKTQRMADALEQILKQQTYYDVIELAANALQQFKDGTKGKEVGNEGQQA